MRNTAIILAGLAAVSLGLVGCDVQKTQEGNLTIPKYEVSKTKEGDVTLPKYDVDAPKVDVTTEKKEVLVPKVIAEKETITVPKVDVTPAKDRDDDKVAQKK